MSRASKARKVATAAAYGGGGLSALGALAWAGLMGVMFGETKLARRRIPVADTDPPNSDDTTWAAAGVSPDRPPIYLAMIGDSLAAGYGVHRERDTTAAQLAIGISGAARRPVHVTNVAVVGAESSDLVSQLDRLEARTRPDLAVIMIGANDVTDGRRPGVPVRCLEQAVRRLTSHGTEVLVGTCPDLGTIRPLPQPLRWYARRLSRRMAAAQTVAAVNAGGRTVSLGDLLGPLFASRIDLFADDQFHPSAAGYAEAVTAMLPSALDALGVRTRSRSASTFTTRRPKPVEKAAVQAAARPGSEVAGADHPLQARIGGGPLARLGRHVPLARLHPRGPAAQLRRRLTRRPELASPETATTLTPR